MTTPRSLLVGGPHDGETISSSQQAGFLWVQMSGKGARCFSAPGEGRSLYRLVHRLRPYKYLYAGHTHAYCQGCGGFSEVSNGRRPTKVYCDFCGEQLPRHE